MNCREFHPAIFYIFKSNHSHAIRRTADSRQNMMQSRRFRLTIPRSAAFVICKTYLKMMMMIIIIIKIAFFET